MSRLTARVRAVLIALAVVGFTLAVIPVQAVSAVAASDGGGVFVPVTPSRIFDTAGNRLAAGTVKSLSVAKTTGGASTGIPSTGVSAVVVDVMARDTVAANVYAYAYDDANPLAILSVGAGDVKDSNTVIVKVGSDHTFNLSVSAGSAEIDVDVQGYFTDTSTDASTGGFVPITPTRLVNSTDGTGIAKAKLAGGSVTTVQIGGRGGIPSNATAVFANIRTLNGTGWGGIRAGANASTVASQSPVVDYTQNGSYDSGASLDIDSSGKLYVTTTTGISTDIIIDVQGYFSAGTDGGGYHPLDNNRVWDSRYSTAGTLTAGEARTVNVSGQAGLPTDIGLGAVALTITAINWTATGGLAVYDPANDEGANGTSNLSWTAGSSTPANTTAIVQADDDGNIVVKNTSNGPVDVLLNAEGWFEPADMPYQDDVTTTPADLSGPTPDAETITAAPTGGSATLPFVPNVDGAYTLAAATGGTVSLTKGGVVTGSFKATAVDADGNVLAATLGVSGVTVTETVTTTSSTSYPVTVTPVFTAADTNNTTTQSLYPDASDLPMDDTGAATDLSKSEIVQAVDQGNADQVAALESADDNLNTSPEGLKGPLRVPDSVHTDQGANPFKVDRGETSNVLYTRTGSNNHWVPVPKWVINGASVMPKHYVYDTKAKHKGWHDYCTKSPDTWKRATFRGPCAQHDLCIQYKEAPDRHTCDNELRWAIKSQCYHTYYDASDRYYTGYLGTTGEYVRYDNYALCNGRADLYWSWVYSYTSVHYANGWGNSNPQTWPNYSYKIW